MQRQVARREYEDSFTDQEVRARQRVQSELCARFGADGQAYWETFLRPLRHAAWEAILREVVGDGAAGGQAVGQGATAPPASAALEAAKRFFALQQRSSTIGTSARTAVRAGAALRHQGGAPFASIFATPV